MAIGGRAAWAAAALVGVAILAAGRAEGGGEACRQAAAAAAVGAPKPTLDRFLFFATLEGLCEDGVSDRAARAALETDADGRYLNFVYGCPICTPVTEGLRAFLLRAEFARDRKNPAGVLLGGGEDEVSRRLDARLADGDRAARGAALHGLVERWTRRHMDRLRLNDEERAQWRQTFEEGRKKGMSRLGDSKGFGFKACPSCDGASEHDWMK